MRILLIVLQYPPDVNATGQLMAQLAEEFAARGHRVTVLAGFPHYEHFRIWPEYRGKVFQKNGASSGPSGRSEIKNVNSEIFRLWIYANGRKTMINRLASYVSFNVMAGFTGMLLRQPWDVILCPNGSFFTGVTGWILGKRKIATVYNVQDLYPDVPILAGQLRNKYAIASLRGIENFMYRKATHVTTISPSMRNAIVSKGISEAKVSIIPNFVDTNFIKPLPRENAFAAKHDLQNRFLVTYAGYLGFAYDLETLIDAAALLASNGNIQFLVVGDGVAKPALEEKAESLGLGNIRFLPFQAHADLPWLRASSDLQLALYKPQAAKHSMPSKVYEIMASGRPILVSSEAGSDVSQLVKETRTGLCIQPGNPQTLANSIMRLYEDAHLREEMGERGRQYAVERYSKERVARQYLELFEEIR